jgi:hypothetical protein
LIPNNLKLVQKQWQTASNKVDIKARMARDDMMTALIQLAKEQIQGARPYTTGPNGGRRYSKATAGEPPMNRTGDLRRSIRGEKFKTGFASYSAIVGPTIVYGRAVEMGGQYAPRSWQGTTAMKGFPYMAPAYKTFQGVVSKQIVQRYFGKGLA